MAITINGSGITSSEIADGTITTDDISSSDVKSLKSGRKNLIINGAMQVAQRGTGAFTANGDFPVDRWSMLSNTTDFTTTQSSTVPTGKGFNKSIKIQPTATKSPSSSTYARIGYKVEGYDGAGLCWGTSGAKSATISFWVRASVAGIYSISPKNGAANRSICLEYTIDSVDTWEYKTITVPAVTDGTWEQTSGNFCYIDFWQAGEGSETSTIGTWQNSNVNMSSNQVNLFTSTSNTFYITGVQLEVGSVATDFEQRSYGEELALCQRYYQKTRNGTGISTNSTTSYLTVGYATTMRTTPTFGLTSGFALNDAGVNSTQSTAHIHMYGGGTDSAFVQMNNFSGLTTYRPTLSRMQGGYITLDAEL